MSKRILNHMLMGLIAFLTAVGLSGCVYDSYPDEPTTGSSGKPIYLTLNIVEADGFGSSTHTRSASYYYEEPERKNESLNNIQIFIVREEDGTIEELRRIDDIYGNYVHVLPSLTFELTRGKKKVYLFGNYTSLSDDLISLFDTLETGNIFPADQISSYVLYREQTSPFFTIDNDIPMCESFTVDLDSENKGLTYMSAEVFVTRIAVKYTFISRDDIDTITVRLYNMAQDQYFMPDYVTYFPSKYEAPDVIDGIAGRNITYFKPPENVRQAHYQLTLTGRTEIELTDSNGTISKAYRYDPVYLMETPGTAFSMSIRFDDGDDMGTWFPTQTLPNLPLLPRNTHVVVYMGVKEYELNCKVDVVPYRGCILDPYFGLDPNQNNNND